MADRVRVAVLISGRGSNMLALAEHKRRDPDRDGGGILAGQLRQADRSSDPLEHVRLVPVTEQFLAEAGPLRRGAD